MSPLIAIVAADKGGVGKTTICRAFLDYCARAGAAARPFDTEPGDGVLRRFHPEAEPLAVDTVPGQMRLVDAANSDAVTVVDARAGTLSPIIRAFERIRLLEDVRNGVLRLLVLHVVGPTVASHGEVAGVAAGLQGAKIVTVCNHANPDARFGDIGGSIDVPYLKEEAAEAVDLLGVPFATFATDPRRSRVLRGYVSAWEADVFAELDRAGVGAMLKGQGS